MLFILYPRPYWQTQKYGLVLFEFSSQIAATIYIGQVTKGEYKHNKTHFRILWDVQIAV